MNKTELVAAIADKAEISKKDSEKALKDFVDVVTEDHEVEVFGKQKNLRKIIRFS